MIAVADWAPTVHDMPRAAAAALLAVLLVSAVLAPRRATAAAPGSALVYFGTYTGPASAGIYVSRFDARTGELTAPELAAPTTHPSFLALHPDGRHLYAVNEVDEFQGESAGAASAFAIDASTGRLRLLGQVSTGGAAPCHLSTDREGHHLFVANYKGGSVAVLPIRPDGSLGPLVSLVRHEGHGPHRERQQGPHAHGVAFDASARLLWVADLGIDQLLAYRVDAATGTLRVPAAVAVRLPPGAGPRHVALGGGGLLFVVEELSLSVSVLRVDPVSGSVTPSQTLSTLPDGVAPAAAFTGAELQLHPSGRFLYVSTRGPDVIAVFAVAPRTPALSRVEVVPSGGRTPRAFTLDPSGRWLLVANQGSDEVVVFRVDPDTGRLTRTGTRVHVGAPVSIVFAQ